MLKVDTVEFIIYVSNIIGSDLMLASNAKYFALSAVLHVFCNNLRVFSGVDNTRGKTLVLGELEKLVFNDVLGAFVVGKQLSLVLNIRSDNGGIRSGLSDLILTLHIVVFRVGKLKVVVLDGSGKEQM
jgi:hypothetical protein